MKWSILVIMTMIVNLVFCQSSEDDRVVMTINDQNVTVDDFLQVYLKNNTNPKFDKESLDDYMDLFQDFKLKVAEARALGYDTVPRIKNELEGYRKQLARPYLVDSSKIKELVKEAYDRYKYEIDASHILIQVDEDASSEDTLKAYNKIMKLKKRVDSGEDFAEVARSKGGSEDPSVDDNGGRLGYFTAFQMVYPFESVAYTTAVGTVGGPVRTSFGYHIVKVHDKRAARGTMSSAHIMIALPKGANENSVNKAKKKINEIHDKLENGEPFEKLVSLYSEDRSTKNKGGVLPDFGSGTSQRMIPEFEDAAFALEEDGDYSKPIRTNYGFHIIKRIEHTPIGSYEELEPMLQSKVNKGERGEKTRSSFVQKLKENNKFKDKSDKRLEWFVENTPKTVYRGTWEGDELEKDKWLFKYNKQKYYSSNFKDYIVNNSRRESRLPIDQHVKKMYDKWQSDVIIKDEESRLGDKYPAYKLLVNEYRDGILLYEIMKDKVWDKAVNDTAGLKAYYNENKEKYTWPDRIEADVYLSANKDVSNEVYSLLASADSLSPRIVLDSINFSSQLNLTHRSGKFDTRNGFLNNRKVDKGINRPYVFEDKYHVLQVKDIVPASPKSFKEARGQVIQDYQEHLEEEWLNLLEQKHEIKINHDVLYSLGK